MKYIIATNKKELADAIAGMTLDEPVKITLRLARSQTVYRFDYPQLCDVLDARGNGNGSGYYRGGGTLYGAKFKSERAYQKMRAADPEARAAMYRDRLVALAAAVNKWPARTFQ